MRELLFGDVPFDEWSAKVELFDAYRAAPDDAGRVAALQSVIETPGLESRHYVETWLGLRDLGRQPTSEQAGRLYGLVFDVPIAGSHDTLAMYEDGSARYLNHGDNVIVWDAHDDLLDSVIEWAVAAATTILGATGPADDGVRPPLNDGLARVSLLSADGVHYGEGPMDALFGQPPLDELFKAATIVMTKLIESSGSTAPPVAPPKKRGLFGRR